MVAPSGRTRLTVEVLPITAQNAHGRFRPQAAAAFKSAKFAMPVQWDDTFRQVWDQIEQRYLGNYLNEQQAAKFTIKKLQDAYDCDLDLRDTVRSIFEGETDPAMRMIKVVPSFIDRDFSIPVTSNLRPGHAQKRLREINAEHANKRRRVEQQQQLEHIEEDVDPPCDQPIQTTESERSRDESERENQANGTRPSKRPRRSRTANSVVIVNDTQIGQPEFGPGVKEESPELAFPSPPSAPRPALIDKTFKKPPVPVSRQTPRKQQQSELQQRTPCVPPREVPGRQVNDEVPEAGHIILEHVPTQEVVAQARPEIVTSPASSSREAAILRSPQATPAEPQLTPAPAPAATKRRDIYDVPSSPEFLDTKSKPRLKKTYSQSPRTANTIQKEAGLLNKSRRMSAHAQTNNNPQQSTPNSVSVSAKKRGRPRKDLTATPVSAPPKPRGRPRKTDSTSSNAQRISKSDRDSATTGKETPVADENLGDPPKKSPGKLGRPRKSNGVNPTQTPDPTSTAKLSEEPGSDVPGANIAVLDDVLEAETPSKLANAAVPTRSSPVVVPEADSTGPGDVPEADTMSRSASAAVSIRSSPAVTRRPARFLSKSPTPEVSDSAEESEDVSTAPSKAVTPPLINEEESESDSSSDSDGSEAENDIEVPDVPADPAPMSTANANIDILPSSPPYSHLVPNSTPLVPETSQATFAQAPRRTPVPLPPNIHRDSSQSVSAQTAARRPTSRYTAFKPLSEQLVEAQTPPTTTQKKPLDLRTMDLGKLTAKSKRIPAVSAGLGNDDESSEEESSSSSSVDSD